MIMQLRSGHVLRTKFQPFNCDRAASRWALHHISSLHWKAEILQINSAKVFGIHHLASMRSFADRLQRDRHADCGRRDANTLRHAV